jgi:hypothetical protein
VSNQSPTNAQVANGGQESNTDNISDIFAMNQLTSDLNNISPIECLDGSNNKTANETPESVTHGLPIPVK